MSSYRGEIYLLLTTLLAALGWGASKVVVGEVPGVLFIGSRFLIAGLILLLFCFKQVLALNWRQLTRLASLGVLLSLTLQLWVSAVSVSESLAEGAFIMSLSMLIAPIASWVLFKQSPNRAFWRSTPIAVLGLALLMLDGNWSFEASQLTYLLSALVASVHFVLNKRVLSEHNISPLPAICVQLMVVGVSGLLGAHSLDIALVTPSKQVIVWFAISTVVATSIRYLTMTLGQHKVNLEMAALIMILEPVWTLLLSLFWFSEPLATQKLIGGAVILLSLYYYVRLNSGSIK